MAESKMEVRSDIPGESGELTKKILRERAAALARELKEETVSETLKFLEFQLSDEYYCVGTEYVTEVCPLREYTRVPCSPDFVFGIVNFHGRILSIVDLKKVLNLSDVGITDRDKVIMLESGGMRFGILTDRLLGIREIAPDSIQKELPPGIDTGNGRYISGVTNEGRIILDSEALLSSPEMIVDESV